jgi:glycosyltransferase involved in cell wall biosynthesis
LSDPEFSKTLVSIVTPSFNQAAYLEETICSVIRQSYPQIEYILMDGGSTDGSLEIIQKYAEHFASWVSEPDEGQVDAINKGLRKATGEIVAWINSDDLYTVGAVAEAVETLQKNPEVGMVYGDGIMVDGKGNLLDLHYYRTYDLLDLLCFEVLLQPTVFMRRNILEQVGFLSADYDLVLDHDLWVKFAAHSSILHVPSFWAVERTHESAKTIALSATFVSEAEKLIERAELSDDIGPLVEGNRRKIAASLHVFSARRLIDASDHQQALQHFFQAFKEKPAVVLKFWYKVIQALGGALGLESLFLVYRSWRRKFQHRSARIIVGEAGAKLVDH